MRNDTPGVAVVIPNWNCIDDLRDCVKSLRAQTGVELEIMVVDNGSTDGSIAWMQQERIPHIPLPDNLGFAHAVNLGFSATTADAVATVNSDTVLEPGALLKMHEVLMSDERIGGVQPRILSMVRGHPQQPDDPDALIYSLGQALTADGRAHEDGIGRAQGDRGFAPREIFGVCGAACMFRRQLVIDLGGYDESYFSFYEDVDLNVRARIAGWSFRLEPSAVIWHVGNAAWHAGFDRPDADNARLVARNRIFTQAKFMPLRSLPRITVVEIGAIFRAITARRFRLTLAGKGAALLRFPEMVRTRRKLGRQGRLELAQAWLGESPGPPAGTIKQPVPGP